MDKTPRYLNSSTWGSNSSLSWSGVGAPPVSPPFTGTHRPLHNDKVRKTSITVKAKAATEIKSMFHTRMWWSTVPVLGVMQILVGLLNISLGPGRTSVRPGDLTSSGAAYWLGALDIVTGIVSIIMGCCFAVFLFIFAVTVNIISSIYAIIGIVLYALDLRDASFIQMCPQSDQYDGECQFLAHVAQSLVVDLDITLIILTVLQLGASITVTSLGIVALCGRWKEKGVGDAEVHQPILKEVLSPDAETDPL